jgi:hypothetical protein
MTDTPDTLEELRGLALFADGQGWHKPAAALFRAIDEIECLRKVFFAAVEFREQYFRGSLNQEMVAREALLDAVSAALDGERRG